MDSYDLFGEDGSGMLEGLPDLGSSTGTYNPDFTGLYINDGMNGIGNFYAYMKL